MARIPVIGTTSQAGYVTGGGRHFRFITTTVKVSPPRKAFQYAGVVLGGAGVPAPALRVKAGGGPGSVGWALGAPFHMAGAAMTRVQPSPGDLVRLSICNDQHGHVYFTAVDTTRGGSETVRMPVVRGTLYTAAEAAVFATGYTAPVPADFRLWLFSGTSVTTCSGVRGTMLGPWVTSRIIATTTGGAAGPVVMSPSLLRSNGADFGVWRR